MRMGPPDEHTFVIADLAGYTALTEAHGDAEAAKTVARYVELVSSALSPGVRLAESVGDQVLVVSDDACSAVTTASNTRPLYHNVVDDEEASPPGEGSQARRGHPFRDGARRRSSGGRAPGRRGALRGRWPAPERAVDLRHRVSRREAALHCRASS